MDTYVFDDHCPISLPKSCTNLYFLEQSIWVPFSSLLMNTQCNQFKKILVCMDNLKWYLIVLNGIFLITNKDNIS